MLSVQGRNLGIPSRDRRKEKSTRDARQLKSHGEKSMKSAIAKRSVVLSGRKTSVSLEPDFWECVKEIARQQQRAVADLVTEIDERREVGNLSSAVRLFVLAHYQSHIAA